MIYARQRASQRTTHTRSTNIPCGSLLCQQRCIHFACQRPAPPFSGSPSQVTDPLRIADRPCDNFCLGLSPHYTSFQFWKFCSELNLQVWHMEAQLVLLMLSNKGFVCKFLWRILNDQDWPSPLPVTNQILPDYNTYPCRQTDPVGVQIGLHTF